MAKAAGRLCVISKNAVPIAGARDVGFSVNGSTIEVTDQGDVNYNTFLDGELTDRVLELTVSGVEADGILQAVALGPAAGYFMDDITFFLPSTNITVSGNFILGNYSETGPHKDAQSFSCTFTSNGAWTTAP